MQGAQT